MIFLFKDKEVSEIAYNDGSYSTLYMLGDLYVERADDVVYKEDFDNNLYYEADETDKKENIIMLDNLHDYESKPKASDTAKIRIRARQIGAIHLSITT